MTRAIRNPMAAAVGAGLLAMTMAMTSAAAAEHTRPLVEPADTQAPPARVAAEAVQRGVDFLLKTQNKNGSWGSVVSGRPAEVYAPVPGAHHAFRAATTSLCIAALIELDGQREDVLASLDRAEQWLLEHLPVLRRATPDAIYNTWGHIYAVDALSLMYTRHEGEPEQQQRIRQSLEQQIAMLDRYEFVNGGWGYYDFRVRTKQPGGSSNCFVTAAGLIALSRARQLDVALPGPMIQRALASINRQRKPDFTYMYSDSFVFRPMHPINRPAGSLGRSQACNAALRIWGETEVTDKVLRTWLDRLFARNGWLDMGRKRPIPHESWFAVAGYFFYFGHYYAAECIELLPPEQREPYCDRMAGLITALQEKDGSWWDFPLYGYHQQYGTAFALRTLVRCTEQPDDGE